MNADQMPNWEDVEKHAVSLIDKGHILQRLGQDAEALAAFDKAATICRPLSGQIERIDLVLSQALDNKGNALVDLGQTARSLACFDEAIQRGTCKQMWGIAISMMNRGRALMLLGENERALDCLEWARQDLASWGSMDDFARVLLNIGEVQFRQGRFLTALEEYDAARFCWEEHFLDDPDAPKSDYAYTFYCKADALLRLGRRHEALESCDRSIALQRAAVNHTNGPREREDLAGAVTVRGRILNKLGHTKQAQACFREAAKLRGSSL
jgi:tetratricopeptide (TPR) repeat protein